MQLVVSKSKSNLVLRIPNREQKRKQASQQTNKQKTKEQTRDTEHLVPASLIIKAYSSLPPFSVNRVMSCTVSHLGSQPQNERQRNGERRWYIWGRIPTLNSGVEI